ncbi:MAG: Trm112 family protein [Acidobacteriota bacterium]
MAIDPELLEILACPVCKKPVQLTEAEDGLRCDECGRVYPIRDDIPVMLVDEATVEDEATSGG